MKKYLLVATAIMILALKTIAQNCTERGSLNSGFSKAVKLQMLMDSCTLKGVPGLSLAVYSETEGWWAGCSGYSKVETKTPMTICNLQYLQSVAKTYMAVTILQLREEGKIDLDAFVTKYLPVKHSRFIQKADKITVRMLLNHTSGIPEYNSNPIYTGYVILNPTKIFVIENALKLIKDETSREQGTITPILTI